MYIKKQLKLKKKNNWISVNHCMFLNWIGKIEKQCKQIKNVYKYSWFDPDFFLFYSYVTIDPHPPCIPCRIVKNTPSTPLPH